MIREIINFTDEISQSNPNIFLLGKRPLEGLHIFVELNEEGKWKNNSPLYKKDYDYYSGKDEPSSLLQEFMRYEDLSKRVGTTMNKSLDKKKQIFSCSPFVISFKKQSFTNDKLEGFGYNKISNLFPFFFEKARTICLEGSNESEIQKSKAFEQVCIEVLSNINIFTIPQTLKDGTEIIDSAFDKMKDSFYINIYLKDIPLKNYKEAHENYLKTKLFNTNNYNSEETEITDKTYGISSFLNGLNYKKPFLAHKTATMYKGISGRISARDAVALNKFDELLSNRSLPNPLPIFIDKNEFTTNIEIIKLFNQSGGKLSYTQILKHICGNENKNISNYYLLLLNKTKGEVQDFDFVSLFRYKMETNEKQCKVLNLFKVQHNKELDIDIPIQTIFDFESKIVKGIFNNSLVKIKNDEMNGYYFDKIDPTYVNGGDLVYQMIMKYRVSFYDYIYKSRQNAINNRMFDDIMYNVIKADIRADEIMDGEYHSKEIEIKKKLNIWFSLYDYFDLSNIQNKNNMASKIPELMNRVRIISNDDNSNLSADPAEFAFAAGQIIYYLLSKSASSNKTYAMLEPILQKHTIEQVQEVITEMINRYKHEINLTNGRFANLSKDVLTYESNENMKKYQRFLLAGCFAPSIIYEKKPDSQNK